MPTLEIFQNNTKIIDLFCGIGGLTHGLQKSGFNVVAGIDNDDTCKFGYEYNNHSKFIRKDILEVDAANLNDLFGETKIKILVGCAPCQPFSKYNSKVVTKKQLEPLEKFAKLIDEIKPDIVSMENVRGLANTDKYPVFQKFLDILIKNNYEYTYEIVNVSDYGVPQARIRLVLLASRLGKISLIEKTHEENKITVKKAIKHLQPIKNGETSKTDPIHKARKLNSINLKRIRATPHDGGSQSSWSEDLILDCHKTEKGKSFKRSVYGRMSWNKPAPTMTTQCVGIGNGRFGHPEQDRAISLREAAIFQTFPDDYLFSDPEKPIITKHVAKFIGNAVPVRLGEIIGESIKYHLKGLFDEQKI